MDFKELGLTEPTIKAINELGISQPTTVQSDVIPSVLEGKDIFAIAPQRSGKTYSYVFPLIEVLAQKKNQNILIITADSFQANNVSDSFALFNKYHESDDEDESNVVIATPDLILDLVKEEKVDLSNTNILVVDDINLLKKKHQLSNLEEVLEKLQHAEAEKKRRRLKDICKKEFGKTPTEIKVDKNKVDEAVSAQANTQTSGFLRKEPEVDEKSLELVSKYKVFGDKTPRFLLIKGELKQ